MSTCTLYMNIHTLMLSAIICTCYSSFRYTLQTSKMNHLDVKLEKQESRTEKKDTLFRQMPSLRDLASECGSDDVQDVILPSAIGRGTYSGTNCAN